MKRLVVTALLVLVLLPSNTHAAINAGFVNGIWYSNTEFIAGQTVRIYTAFQNHSSADIVGIIDFSDNGVSIGTVNLSIPKDQLISRWLDWVVTEGTHQITVRLIDLGASLPGQEQVPTEVVVDEIVAETFEADGDADGDGMGDSNDPDDDNDGLSDEEENDLGTDPFDPDTDDDGVPDGQEIDNSTDPLDSSSKPSDPPQEIVSDDSSDDSEGVISNVKESLSNLTNSSGLKNVGSLTKAVSKTTLYTIDSVADGLNEVVEKKIQDIKIAQGNSENTLTVEDEVSSPVKVLLYAGLGVLQLMSFVLEVKIILYIVLLILLFLVIRWVWEKVFKKDDYDY